MYVAPSDAPLLPTVVHCALCDQEIDRDRSGETTDVEQRRARILAHVATCGKDRR